MGKNIIAVVFDFDITLSPYYQQKELLAHWGEDEDKFWQKCTSKVIDEDYDLEHGYIKVILEYIEKNPNYAISNQDLYNIGKNIQLYDGLSKRNNQNSIFEEKTKQTYKKSYTFAIKSQRAKQLLPANYSDAKPLKIALLNYIEMLCDKFKNR
jgi:hypothetical protein